MRSAQPVSAVSKVRRKNRYQIKSALIPVLPLIFCSFFSLAQTTDSLKAILKKNIHDTTRIDVYNSIGAGLWFSDIQESEKYISKALNESKEKGYKRGIAKSYNNLASVELIKRNYAKSEQLYKEAIKAWEKVGDKYNMYVTYDNLGLLYSNTGEWEKSLKLLMENHDRWEKLGNEVKVARVCGHLGKLYRSLNRESEAGRYYLKSYLLSKKNKLETDHIESAIGLGTHLHRIGKLDSALHYAREALSLSTAQNNALKTASSYHLMGNIFIDQKKYNEALDCFKNQKKEIVKFGGIADTLEVDYNIGRTYTGIGKYKEAKAILMACLAKSGGLEDLTFRRDIYGMLYRIDVDLKDYKSAIVNMEKYFELKDSLTYTEHLKAVEQYEARYESEKKNNQIELLSKKIEINALSGEKEKKRNQAIILAAGLIVLFLIVVIIVIRSRNRLNQVQSEKYTTELNLQMLLLQVNPHFYFNTLNNIYGHMISEKATARSKELILNFSDLMRFLVDNAEKHEIKLSAFNAFLQDYLNLMQERFGGRCKINFSFEQSNPETMVAHYTIFPFIENAFKYGTNTKNEIIITISLKEAEGIISLYIHNKIYDAMAGIKTGKGISTIKKCLEILYKGKYTLVAGPENGNYIVNLSIDQNHAKT